MQAKLSKRIIEQMCNVKHSFLSLPVNAQYDRYLLVIPRYKIISTNNIRTNGVIVDSKAYAVIEDIRDAMCELGLSELLTPAARQHNISVWKEVTMPLRFSNYYNDLNMGIHIGDWLIEKDDGKSLYLSDNYGNMLLYPVKNKYVELDIVDYLESKSNIHSMAECSSVEERFKQDIYCMAQYTFIDVPHSDSNKCETFFTSNSILAYVYLSMYGNVDSQGFGEIKLSNACTELKLHRTSFMRTIRWLNSIQILSEYHYTGQDTIAYNINGYSDLHTHTSSGYFYFAESSFKELANRHYDKSDAIRRVDIIRGIFKAVAGTNSNSSGVYNVKPGTFGTAIFGKKRRMGYKKKIIESVLKCKIFNVVVNGVTGALSFTMNALFSARNILEDSFTSFVQLLEERLELIEVNEDNAQYVHKLKDAKQRASFKNILGKVPSIEELVTHIVHILRYPPKDKIHNIVSYVYSMCTQ